MPNTPAVREKRKEARIWCPAGQMPATWDDLSNAEKAQFSLEDREKLRVGAFWWAPIAIHGEYNSYGNHYCRCPLCQEANRRTKAEGRAKNKMNNYVPDVES